MVAVSTGKVRSLTRGAVVVALAFFLTGPFRTGWTTNATDFPNYYTAAVLVRDRQPLRMFYDWTWFARQMNYAGVEKQLGAWTPQTPLTMLPMVAFAGCPPQTAKRVWLVVNLALLLVTFFLLARLSGLWPETIALVALCGYSGLAANFIYGQYYVFLLFQLTLAVYCVHRKASASSGFISGITFALKLYTGPFFLYFLARRNIRSAATMLLAIACAGVLAVALFGSRDIAYYLTHILPRTLEGASIDPWNAGVPSFSTLLRRLFLKDPALNPHPALDAPWLFFFLRTLLQFTLLAFATLAIARVSNVDEKRDLAWFVILAILLSTSTASYTFVLLLLPVTVLLPSAAPAMRIYLVASYILLNTGLRAAWLFPRLWLLLALFLIVGWGRLYAIPRRWALTAALGVLALSLADAQRHMSLYRREPGRRYTQIEDRPGSLFAGYPAITRAGLFYQGMGDERVGEDGYLLCWIHGGAPNCRSFGGYAVRPHTLAPGGDIGFELISHGRSTFMKFDPRTETATPEAAPQFTFSQPSVVSPDGKWSALIRETPTSRQLWIRNRISGETRELGGGDCDNSSPAWELDSSAVVFASDCGRAFGLSALYRAPIW